MIKRIGYGIVLWLIPYVASLPLLPLRTSDPLVFKSLIECVALISASVLIVLYFKEVKSNFLRDAVITALVWAAVSLILDMIALIPFAHLTLSEYFIQIGIQYLAGMAPVIAVGYLLERVHEQK